MFSLLCLRKQVEVFGFSIHWLSGKMADKIGFSCLLRRSFAGEPLIVALVRSHDILKVNTENLSKCLATYGASCRKVATKCNKIRHILKLGVLKDRLSQQEVSELEAKMLQIEQRRRKAAKEGDKVEEDDEEATAPKQYQFASVTFIPIPHPLYRPKSMPTTRTRQWQQPKSFWPRLKAMRMTKLDNADFILAYMS